MNERDIMILFGAGASHGARHVQPQAPPLGAKLYDALATQYPSEWGSESHLGKMWAAKLREDFEQTMYEEVLPRVSSLSLVEWHRSVAAFFAGYALDHSGRDMYSLLLSGLRTRGLLRRVIVGSLNYDCLLEQAMLELRLNVDYMLGNPPSEGSIPLAKIHGSCNFITSDLFSKRAYMTNANASSIECSFTPLPVSGLEACLRKRFSTHEPAFFPVLGLYSPDKPSIVAPAKLQSLRNFLAERITQATAIVLIGLKPNSRDPHLWDPIAQSRAAGVAYVGGNDDYDRLKALHPRATHVATTFEAGVAAVIHTMSDWAMNPSSADHGDG